MKYVVFIDALGFKKFERGMKARVGENSSLKEVHEMFVYQYKASFTELFHGALVDHAFEPLTVNGRTVYAPDFQAVQVNSFRYPIAFSFGLIAICRDLPASFRLPRPCFTQVIQLMAFPCEVRFLWAF